MLGIPFCVVDSFGFKIFSINELNNDCLDGIVEDIESSNMIEKMKKQIVENAMPVETETEGIFYLDLVLLQTECPEISSKKALKDFLNTTPFLELQLLCNHIPPWLENGEYEISSQKTPDKKTFATIRKNYNRGYCNA